MTYRPVMVYQPVNYGCFGAVSCGCVGNYGPGIISGGNGDRHEWSPGRQKMPPSADKDRDDKDRKDGDRKGKDKDKSGRDDN
jgi:hypothetical protein